MRILLVSGSTRDASTHTTVLRAMVELAPEGVVAWCYGGLSDLPAFNPDHSASAGSHPAVGHLRRELAAADAVLFCTPEYAHSMPGSLKNLLDWTALGGELKGRRVAWLDVAPEGRGEYAPAHLAIVLRYLETTIVEDACRRVTVTRDAIAPDGTITDPAVRTALTALLTALAT